MRKLSLILLFWIFSWLLAIGTQQASAQTSSATASTAFPGTPTATPGLLPTPVDGIQTATPGADGKIVHKVISGQTLIIIASAYGVDINDLMALNGLNKDSVIFPDQELIIQAGFTATPTSPPTRTATQTRIPTSTRRPTRTPLPSVQAVATTEPALQTQPVPATSSAQPRSDVVGKILLVVIAVLGLGGVFLIVLGALLRRSP